MRVSRAVRAVVLAAATACAATAAARASPRWTVALYLDGDAPDGQPDLEAEVVARVASLLALPDDAAVRVVALVDRRGGSAATIPSRRASAPAGTPCSPTAWAGARTFVLQAGCAVEVAEHGPTNLGDPATLDALLARVATDHPAERYALVLKGHAVPAGSICLDAVPGGGADDLTVEELRGVLDRFAGTTRRRVALLALDGCALGTVETLAPVAEVVDHVLASPDLLFARSLPYGAMLEAMRRDPAASAAAVADATVAAYPEDRRVNGPQQGCDRETSFGVLASVASAGVLAVKQAFDRLGDGARADLEARPAARSELVAACVRAFAYPSEGFVDAASLAARIAAATTDATVRGLALAAGDAVRSAVVVVGAGPDMADSCGLSICAALCDEPRGYFGAHAWSGAGWTSFLKAFVPCPPQALEAPPRSTVRVVGSDLEVTTADVGRSPSTPRFARAELVARVAAADGGSEGHAVYRRPFSVDLAPDAADPTAAAGFRDVWDRGRLVFRGIPVPADGQTAEIECPIASIQALTPTPGRRHAVATTDLVEVKLSTGWQGHANLRLHVTETSGPSGTATTARITCAYVAALEPSRPDLRGRPRAYFARVPLDAGATLRTTRTRVVDGVERTDVGPELRIDPSRQAPCLVYAPFRRGLTLVLGHAVYPSTTGLRFESSVVVPGH